LPRLLVECAAAQTILAAQLAAPHVPVPAPLADNAANAPESDVLLTVAEAAARLKCSPKTLYRRHKSKNCPFFVNMPGRGVRISERRFNKFLERR
jgi:excisionase family DNA binding protein